MTGGPADARGRSSQPGIQSWHCFSSGPYYDPARLSLGPIVGVDEHLVAPGAGFDWHAHRGVQIASWVLDGTLRHEDSRGEVRSVRPGALFVQSTGRDGIRHREWNASDSESLRLVQLTIVGEEEPGCFFADLPVTLGGVRVDVRPEFPNRFPALALVLRGEFAAQHGEPIPAGACVVFEEDDHRTYVNAGDALALVLQLDA